jgi:adenylate kinase family enzyme
MFTWLIVAIVVVGVWWSCRKSRSVSNNFDSFTLDNLANKRIWIIGHSASGKSSLAWMLHQIGGQKQPVLHIDHIRFKKDTRTFENRPRAEIHESLQEFISENELCWIIEGVIGYTPSNEVLNDKTEVLIWLEYPLYVNLWRVIKRSSIRTWTGTKLFNSENREQFWTLIKFWNSSSIINWTLTHYKSVRKANQQRKEMFLSRMAADPQSNLFHFTSPKSLELKLIALIGDQAYFALLNKLDFTL